MEQIVNPSPASAGHHARVSEREREQWNGARWTAGDPRGHYESWFMRANHPTDARAFWIRYTIFSPKGRPAEALGELWAIVFDGARVVAVKEERSIRECNFAKSELSARIAEARLDAETLAGKATCDGHTIAWSLRFTAPEPPLLFLDRALYGGSFPKAKSLVPAPHARFDGTITVDGEPWAIDAWRGSQNHNWGEKHTDRYAWGQVAGFDDAPDAFLEVATAQVLLGPVMSPPLTLLVLRIDGEELAFNRIGRALRAKGSYDFFQWRFETGDARAQVSGTIAAPAERFVGLPYMNPPGGTKTCLNTKIARCDLTLRRPGRSPLALSTSHRAAFEILTSATDHGVPVLDPRR